MKIQMVVKYFCYHWTLTEEMIDDIRTQVYVFRKRGDTLHSHSPPLICLPYDTDYSHMLGFSPVRVP